MFLLEIKGPKYADGVYLLYPFSVNPTTKTPMTNYDVVFVHGVNGDAFFTWRQLEPSDMDPISVVRTLRKSVDPSDKKSDTAPPQDLVLDDTPSTKDQAAIIWPKDWLAKDIPDARILTVGYDIYLSKWFGDALPLEQQAQEMLKKLKLAGIGTKPVIFVTHSFGGLLVKEMLIQAQSSSSYSSILKNTRGIAFFSTPHRGSNLTKLDSYYFLNSIFRGTVTIQELKPTFEKLEVMNKMFPKVASHVATLSFGENDKTCIGSKYSCIQLVADSSANPGFVGADHKFVKLDLNHRAVCKPLNRDSVSYRELLAFIKHLTRSQK
jgi:hypothetical protein